MIGQRLGQYEITSILGKGGMGVVYGGRDTKLNRPVAIKVLSDDVADASARRRFQREAQMASSLNHPHILTVYDAGEFEGRQYLVTELIDGGSLTAWINEKHPELLDLVELIIGVADGLAAAHDAGILHRDLKPANILVAKNGYAKLVDFGLAKLEQPSDTDLTLNSVDATRPGIVVGTIAYMSPEQASGKPLDARSDIFSFGVTLYEAVSGSRPFDGATSLELLQQIIHSPAKPLPESVPPAMRMLIEKALQKDPADRYPAMRDMVADLRRITRQTDIGISQVRKKPKSRRWLWISAAAALALALTAVVLFWRDPSPPQGPIQYVQLTNFADSATQPALSPDGRMLAFIRGPETFMGSGQVFIKLLPSGEPVQLTNDKLLKMAPRFSADGSLVAYTTLDTAWDTWVVPVLGGQQPRRFLSNAEGLNWIQERTKDGARQPRLLFSELTGKGITMAIVSSTESRSDQRTVYVQDGIMDHFSYLSPDGTQLLLAEMSFNGWQPCRLAPYDGSSKGSQVGPIPSQCTGAAWSPDGQWMYFSANTGSGFHIWRQRFPNGTVEQVTFGPATEEEGVEMAPDGRSFITSVGTRQSTLWIHDSRGDRQVTTDGYAFLPKFSVDGMKIFYLVREAGEIGPDRGSLWVMDLASSERQRLLPDYLMQHYSVSVDGKSVVFVDATSKDRTGVWQATLDGRAAPRRLTASPGVTAFFGVAGDIVFAAQEKDGTFIYRDKGDGSAPTKVSIPYAVHYLYGISPDGKYAAAWVHGSTPETANSVWFYSLDGGSPIWMCKNCAERSSDEPGFVSWSADGKFFYISIWRQATYAIPLRQGQTLPAFPASGIGAVEDVAALPGAKPFPVPAAFSGPDPSIYAFPKLSAQRNLYRVPIVR